MANEGFRLPKLNSASQLPTPDSRLLNSDSRLFLPIAHYPVSY